MKCHDAVVIQTQKYPDRNRNKKCHYFTFCARAIQFDYLKLARQNTVHKGSFHKRSRAKSIKIETMDVAYLRFPQLLQHRK